jgi:hypothetical protein
MPRRRDTGSVTLLYVLCLMLLGGFAVAGLVIGRQAFERRELQTEADAIALAAVYSVQQLGLPHKTAPALPKGTRNTRLPFTSKFYPVERRLNEHRTLVRVELEGTLDTKQTWFPQRFLKPRVEAWAQINEVEYGDVWPVVFFAIEATESMNWVLQGSNNKTAFSLVGDLIQQYAQNTLPVRNGVALFWTDMVGGNPTTEHWVPSPPPLPNDHNFVGIKNVLNNPPNPLAGLTNIASALKNTRNLLDQYQGDRYAVLVSDGEATLGPACGPKEGCHFDNLAGEAIPEAQQLRMAPQQGTTLVGLEILRSNWFVRQSNLMCASSGEFLAPNGGPANHFALPDVVSHDLPTSPSTPPPSRTSSGDLRRPSAPSVRSTPRPTRRQTHFGPAPRSASRGHSPATRASPTRGSACSSSSATRTVRRSASIASPTSTWHGISPASSTGRRTPAAGHPSLAPAART